MRTSAVNSKYIFSQGKRFEGKFYLNDNSFLSMEIERHVEKTKPLSELATVFNPPVFKRQFCQQTERSVPYFQSSDVPMAKEKSQVFIFKGQAEDLNLLVKRGDILVTGFGTIGNTRLVSKFQDGTCYANNVCRIRTNESVYKGFVYSFLSSKFGISQLNKNASGSVVRYIEAPGIKKTLIPDFPLSFQQKIDEIIQESTRLREEATESLEEAIKYFDDLYPIKVNFSQTFSLNLKGLKLGFAAYNNNLEVDEFVSAYECNSYKLKSKTSNVFAPPLFKHIYLNKDNGYPFMTGSELTQFNLRYYRWLSPRGVKDINDYVVKRGTLLLYKSGTTDGGILGNVFIADKKLDGCCLSDHVIRVVFEEERQAYWAFAFLRSKGAVKMLQRLATGTMIPFITPERLSEILIPNPDDNYDKITSLVESYINLNSKSKEFEDAAITMVEQEIEKWNN